jgi:hypothetical protein
MIDDGRTPLKESEVGTEADMPHTWVIEVFLSVQQARELGKVLGKAGYTGKFIDGDIASLALDGAKYRKMKGGDEVG